MCNSGRGQAFKGAKLNSNEPEGKLSAGGFGELEDDSLELHNESTSTTELNCLNYTDTSS